MKQKQKIFSSVVGMLCIAGLFLSCNTNSNAKAETLNADYVVVGGGAAGLMSALELSEKGKVVLLEKMPGLGGTSIRAKGFLWSIDSALNKATGKGLTAQQMFDYYKEKAGAENFNAELFQAMLDVSGSVVDDLLQKGMPFSKERLIPGTPNYPQLLCLTGDGKSEFF